jgi:drug/metabolite transporter (DMT)-like permease
MRLFLLTCLTMLFFASNSLLTRAGVADGMDPLTFAAIRVGAGAVFLGALALWQKGQVPLRGRARMLSVIALSVYLFGFSLSYLTLDAGLGALILFATVQLCLFGAAITFGEAISTRRWLGMGLALGGLGLLLLPGGGTKVDGLGAAWMALGGAGWALYTYMGKSSSWALGNSAGNFLLSTGVLLLAAPFWWGGAITPMGLACAVASGAIASGLGYALWFVVLPQMATTTAGVAQLCVPVIAVIGGAFLLAEPVTLPIMGACAVVLGGIALATIPPRRQNRA